MTEVRGALARLRAGLCEETAAETLQALQALLDEARTLQLRAIRLADAARRGEPRAAQRDTAGQLADQLSIPRREARRQVAAARALAALPEVAEALETGEITPAAAEAITAARRQPADIDALRAAQAELLEAARTEHPDAVAKRARWVVAADDEQHERSRRRQEANRGLRFRDRADGLVGLEGALLPETAEAWRTILDPLVKASYRQPGDPAEETSGRDGGAPAPDARNAAQRMHDAFDQVGRRVLGLGLSPRVHGAPAKVIVGIDLRSLDPACHTPGLLDVLGLDPDRIRAAAASLLPQGAGLLPETGTLLPAPLVRRLATEDGVELIPFLFDGYTPLARGRSVRFATHDQRLALILRDQGCVDCGAPPSWCDADHDPSWEDGGRSDPDAMVLRCKPQHVDRHATEDRPPGRPPDTRMPASAAGPRSAERGPGRRRQGARRPRAAPAAGRAGDDLDVPRRG